MLYLDNADNVFLSAEYAGGNMAVGGLMELGGKVDKKRLADDLERFSAGVDRFRQRLVVGKGTFTRPYWQPVGAEFDIGNHLTFASMPESLHDDIGRLMETPLSFSVPLWHVTCYQSKTASYLLFRVSHMISDGQGLSRTVASQLLTDKTPSCPNKQHRAGRQFHRQHILSWPSRLIAYLIMAVVMLYNCLNVLLHTRRSLRAPKHAVRHQVGFSSGVKVSEVKDLRRAIGSSFNDIVVACAASAIERHLVECGRLNDTRTLFMIPTSLRADHDSSLSNQVQSSLLGRS